MFSISICEGTRREIRSFRSARKTAAQDLYAKITTTRDKISFMHEEPKIKSQNLQMKTPVCLKYKSVSPQANYQHVRLFLVSSEMYINSE